MNGFTLPTQKDNYFFHHVQPGDTLSKIVTEYFPDNKHGMNNHIQQIQVDNPEIRNPDLITVGQVIVLRTPGENMCLAPLDYKGVDYVKNLWNNTDEQTRQAIKETSPWYNGLALGFAGGGTAMFTLENTLKSNMHLLNGVPDAYADYKSGKITKGQYDYIRKTKLDLYSKNIGPMIKKVVYGSDTPHGSFKMKPGPSLDATKPLTQHMDKLAKISKTASKGSIALAVVGLGASCYQISQTDSRTEKNEIGIETISGTIASTTTAGGIALGIMLIGTPIGWGLILLGGVVSAGVGLVAGHTMKQLYKTNKLGNTDFVDKIGIDKFCN